MLVLEDDFTFGDFDNRDSKNEPNHFKNDEPNLFFDSAGSFFPGALVALTMATCRRATSYVQCRELWGRRSREDRM